jgi:hypothetical protein
MFVDFGDDGELTYYVQYDPETVPHRRRVVALWHSEKSLKPARG